jgi:hypothetical protein
MDDEMSYDNNNNTRLSVSNPEARLRAGTLIAAGIGMRKA